MPAASSSHAAFRASPNLALVKYWGKADTDNNLPATSSLGITLKNLTTETSVKITDKDTVFVNQKLVPPERYAPFFDRAREALGVSCRFHCESKNNFPTSAGLASSSSGFACLAYACAEAAQKKISPENLSRLARLGSASAARSVFGGFVSLPRLSEHAKPLYDEDFWPELRVIIVQITAAAKDISSRSAMERTRLTSPFYAAWCENAETMYAEALLSLEHKDIQKLGDVIRANYLCMFATMLSCRPAVIYWLPESVALIQACEDFRKQGLGVWETMDAGPQVKLICLENDLAAILARLEKAFPQCPTIVSSPGPAPSKIIR